jgi:hypothetical protein
VRLELPTSEVEILAPVVWPEQWHPAPGPSYLPDRVVTDLADDGVAGPVSLRIGGTGNVVPETQLACHPSDPEEPYAVAEVGPGGACVGWWSRAYWSDGTNQLAPAPEASFTGRQRFGVSPGGHRTIPVSSCGSRGWSPDGSWPVFDGAPSVAYELLGVGCLRGANFSPAGDTLYAVVTDTAEAWPQTWVVQVRDAADGRLIVGRALDDVLEAFDILPDPHHPWLYVAGVTRAPVGGFALLVLDRVTLEDVALVLVPREYDIPYYGSLLWSAAWGLYFYGIADCVGDCGFVWGFDTPARYPP